MTYAGKLWERELSMAHAPGIEHEDEQEHEHEYN
jgi:hypothetical protein